VHRCLSLLPSYPHAQFTRENGHSLKQLPRTSSASYHRGTSFWITRVLLHVLGHTRCVVVGYQEEKACLWVGVGGAALYAPMLKEVGDTYSAALAATHSNCHKHTEHTFSSILLRHIQSRRLFAPSILLRTLHLYQSRPPLPCPHLRYIQ
jgi:hypothetical protein